MKLNRGNEVFTKPAELKKEMKAIVKEMDDEDAQRVRNYVEGDYSFTWNQKLRDDIPLKDWPEGSGKAAHEELNEMMDRLPRYEGKSMRGLIFEDADEEFPASVRLLYDKNTIFYMPHEQLGDISWFLAGRVLSAIQ